MQLHPKKSLGRGFLTESLVDDINVGYLFYQYSLSQLLWQWYIHISEENRDISGSAINVPLQQ